MSVQTTTKKLWHSNPALDTVKARWITKAMGNGEQLHKIHYLRGILSLFSDFYCLQNHAYYTSHGNWVQWTAKS